MSPTQGTITVQSPDIQEGEPIPKAHARKPDGSNKVPRLEWTQPPAGTKEVVVLVDDPDAPSPQPWVHWVLYGLPGDARSLAAGGKKAVEGKNSWGNVGWEGPQPPVGHGTHHYHFRVHALNEPIGLAPGATKQQVLDAMRGHVLAQGELVGTYER